MTIAPFRAGLDRQLARFLDALAAGMPRVGWKIGINVPEVQRQLGLPHAGTGWVNGDQVYETGQVLELPSSAKLHVEAEAAIRLGSAVSGKDSLSAARRSIRTIHPALELVDYAIPTSSVEDLLGHSMFHAGAVLGPGLPPASWRSVPSGFPCLTVGGRSASAKRTDLVPQDLGEVVQFVAQFLAEFEVALEKDDIILAGSYLPTALPVSECGLVRADFAELGSAEIEYAGAAAE